MHNHSYSQLYKEVLFFLLLRKCVLCDWNVEYAQHMSVHTWRGRKHNADDVDCRFDQRREGGSDDDNTDDDLEDVTGNTITEPYQ